MSKVVSNIVKGIAGRLSRKSKHLNPSEISWLQQKILKHQDDSKTKIYQFKDFKIAYIRPYELLHTYQELFVNEIYKFKADTSTPVIIDCGANIGLSILYFKKIYKQAQIEAFEPDGKNFELLVQNCNINGLQQV